MESVQDSKKNFAKDIGIVPVLFFSFKSKLKIPAIIFLFFIPMIAFAEDDDNDIAITLGWLAIGLGVVANLLLLGFKIMRKLPVMKLVGGYESTLALTSFYKPVLNLHIMLNLIGFFAGMSHGIMLLGGIDYISLSLAVIIIFSMVSGIVLKYSSYKNLKYFGRLAHGQFILAILLVILVILHVSTMN